MGYIILSLQYKMTMRKPLCSRVKQPAWYQCLDQVLNWGDTIEESFLQKWPAMFNFPVSSVDKLCHIKTMIWLWHRNNRAVKSWCHNRIIIILNVSYNITICQQKRSLDWNQSEAFLNNFLRIYVIWYEM